MATKQNSIDRFLRQSDYEYFLLTSRLFKVSRDVVEGKAHFLLEKGLGDIRDILWECEKLGDKTFIMSTLWWQLAQQFGLRRKQEHHSVIAKDFSFRKDGTGASNIVFAEIRKAKQSGLHEKRWLQLPEFFESRSERRSVKLVQRYFSKHPVGMEKSGPSYLQPTVYPFTTIWYKKILMGINSINFMIKALISNSPPKNSEKHLANHSVRKMLVKTLKQQQLPKSEIISITGLQKHSPRVVL